MDGKAVAFRSRKAEGLLARLCLTGDGRMSREMAANLFWQDSSEHHSRSSLRQTLLILRRALEDAGFDGLDSDKMNIHLDLSRVRLDMDDLISGTADAVPARLLVEKRLSERLFEGGEMLAEPFHNWLRLRRQQFHDHLRSFLEPMVRLDSGNWTRMEQAAVALLNLDPTHEPACRAFITARAVQGDYTGALRAYEDLWNVLEEEFDTQPSSETQSLIVDIKLGKFSDWLQRERARLAEEAERKGDRPAVSAGTRAEAAARHVNPVIVVDQILQVTEADEDIRLAKVFRHDLISRLVRFREWSVADEVTEELSGSAAPIYRVSISAMRADRAVSYSVTVKNSRTNAYVWGRNSAVEIGELFARQSTLVAEIAMAMNVNISAERLANMSRVPNASLDQYDRLLMGQRLHYTWKIEDSHRAEEVLNRLIKDNPRFGPAYSSLAQIINSRHIVFPGQVQTPETLERSAGLARTALALDPFDSRGYLCAAWTLALQRRFEQAEAHHRQALELNDNDPWTALSAAHGLAYYGHREEALAIAYRHRENGLLTSPLHWSYFVGITCLCGDHAGSIAAFRYLSDGYLGVEAWYVASLALTGDVEEAKAQARHLRQRVTDRWVLPQPPDDADIARWIGNCFPISSPRTWDEIHHGLALAGLVLPADLAPPGARD
ncbi:BTAD domain-containing putative transcriptional regulator [Stappia sp. TSB10GB4]|uniref:BTAD domain-containing putative transcriptional regulator n=1 Tax=Stappia sp. TSB10GB4 TaxID=2003584 RepID=UPI001644BF78|nr:BTAD domain-containing putative transcriptional regulator [Stappia sp. TSB10GB4]